MRKIWEIIKQATNTSATKPYVKLRTDIQKH